MAYDAKAVANYFLDKAESSGTTLTPMKLQKLVFFAHGWHLGLNDEPLISDPIEAWQFGPVVPSLYHEFKHERAGAITGRATELDLEDFKYQAPTVRDDDIGAKKLMDSVWNTYGKLTAVQLSNLTHLPNSPWDLARKKYDGDMRSVPIDDDLIRTYFRQEAEKNRAKRAAAA